MPPKTKEQQDIDSLAETVLGIKQQLQATGYLDTPLRATFKADDGRLVEAQILASLAGRRC